MPGKSKAKPSYLLRRPSGDWNHGKRQLYTSAKVKAARNASGRGGVRR